jgi:FkbM family methyltransferase
MFGRCVTRVLCWLTRTFPNVRGRWRLVHWLRRHESLVKRLAPTTVKLPDGFRMHVNPADLDGKEVFITAGPFSVELVNYFRLLARNGDCVIDVGANIGYFTLLSSRLVGPEGKVHAFEPSPQILRFLKKNLGLNDCKNVVLHEQAASDRCGETLFCTASSDRMGLSSMRELGTQGATRTMVCTVSIDSMLKDVPTTKLVKIDVEGAEFSVLRGMTQLMKRDAPYIIMELTDSFLREMGSSAEKVLEFLREHDYAVYLVEERAPYGLRSMVAAPDSQCDIVAVPSAKPLPEESRTD